MTFISEFSEEFKNKMKKLKRKNSVLFNAAIDKIREIELHPKSYKPLKYEMTGYRRVHLLKSFVLIFKIDIKSNKILFEDLDHHDKIYRK